MFDITNGKGFKMTFANGCTVSVQFGGYNYCEYYNHAAGAGYHGASKDAEIAAWDKYGNWYNFGDDTVKGYVSADEVLAFMNVIANWDGASR